MATVALSARILHEPLLLRRSLRMPGDQLNLTNRDREVLDLLSQGCSNKEIGGKLQISPRTVKQHLRLVALRNGINTDQTSGLRVLLMLAGKNDEPAKEDSVRAKKAWRKLTDRSRECASLTAIGLANKATAEKMGTTVQVVKNYLRRVYDGLGVSSKLELAVWYRAHGSCLVNETLVSSVGS